MVYIQIKRSNEGFFMKGLLAINRLIILYKELCRANSLDLTYNEFIVIIAVNSGYTFLGRLHHSTLIDRGQLTRILSSLVEKEVLSRDEDNRYHLTPKGNHHIELLFKERDDFHFSLLTQDEIDELEKAKTSIMTYEEKLRKNILGS